MMELRARKKNKVTIRISQKLYDDILADLKKPHAHAAERVGFTYSRMQKLSDGEILIVMNQFEPVEDFNYLKDSTVGAHINSDAIFSAMRKTVEEQCGAFHTHLHWGKGIPSFSGTDLSSLPSVVKSFIVDSSEAHGLLLLNDDSLNCLVWLPGQKGPVYVDKIVVAGYPSLLTYPKLARDRSAPERLKRQSFLGEYSYWLFKMIKVGVVGLGGGGSHVVQQLAHLGVENFVLFDSDRIEESNLNRMVGSTAKDVRNSTLKVEIARRIIKAISPTASIKMVPEIWEKAAESLQSCDIVFGCIDSIAGRKDLEAECRRYLISMIDIGMDVHLGRNGYDIRGQIIASIPGSPCFKCLEFINEENLRLEAMKYGNAGERPQVVWSNGVLASTAVGIFVDIVNGWTKRKGDVIYLSYNGNSGILTSHPRSEFPIQSVCSHYPAEKTGSPRWKKTITKA